MRFDARDWNGSQRDAVERIELYDRFVNQTIAELRTALGAAAQDRALWRRGAQRIRRADRRRCRTRSSPRRSSAPSAAGCSAPWGWRRTSSSWPPTSIRSPTSIPPSAPTPTVNHGSLSLLFEDLLGDVRFRSPWRDLDKSIAHVTGEVTPTHARGERRPVEQVEVIRPVFYQISRAYIVGRLVGREFLVPLVIALKNSDGGVLVDAVMLAEDDVSIVFSFTRSYFHADLERVAEAVLFLKSIMPRKPVSELFTVLGRARQGKTERYRELMRNLEHTTRPVRTRARRARPGDGVLHAALLRRGVQGDPRPLRLPEDGAARGGAGEIPHGVHPRPRRAAGGRAGIPPPALSARALRARAARRSSRREAAGTVHRGRRPTWCSITCTSSGA